MLSSDVGGKPETSNGVVTYHKVTLRKKHRRNHSQRASGEKENHRRNHSRGACGENQRQNHSQRASGEKKEVTQQEYEDSEKNTKIWSDDEKNREEQSQRQAKQTEGLRTEARRSTRRSTPQRKAAASQVQDLQQGQYELKLDEGITTITTIEINEETVEYKNTNYPDSSEAATQKVQKIVMHSFSLTAQDQ